MFAKHKMKSVDISSVPTKAARKQKQKSASGSPKARKTSPKRMPATKPVVKRRRRKHRRPGAKMNGYFVAMNQARKSKKPMFNYNGKTYYRNQHDPSGKHGHLAAFYSLKKP